MGLPLAAPIAPLGRRSAAYLVDSLIIGLAYLVLGILFDSIFGPLVAATPDGQALVVVAVNPLRVALELTATLVVDALYFAGCWSRWGATPGQRVLRIRVLLERATGPAGAGSAGAGSAHDTSVALPLEAAGRRWAVLAVLPIATGSLAGLPIATGSLAGSGAIDVSVLTVVNGAWFLLLLASTAADPLRRGLHDRVAGTIVVPVQRPSIR
jgi:uncharacterized RDD family membrane protein YckC